MAPQNHSTYAAAAFLILTLFVTTTASAQDTLTFNDWSVVCKKQTGCTAQTVATGRTDAETYTFVFKLRTSLDGVEQMRILFDFETQAPGERSPLIFQVDDRQSFRFEPDGGYERVDDDFELRGQPQVINLIDALAQGRALFITFINPKLRETGLAFSLNGLPEALREISQRRSN